MARKKAAVVQGQPVPEPPEVKSLDSMPTPSGSFSSSSTHPTCPHCQSIFADMSTTDFRDHVAGCSRPSTAEEDGGSTSSSLSSPPLSPSDPESVPTNSMLADTAQVVAVVPSAAAAGPGSVIAEKSPAQEPEVISNVNGDVIRPYLDPETEFDYYDQAEPAEEPEADSKDPDLSEDPKNDDSEYIGEPSKVIATVESSSEPIELIENSTASDSPAKVVLAKKQTTKKIENQKTSFPKFTPVEVFEDYLNEPELLDYDELYKRTAKVSECLITYQTEWASIEKEILAHETLLRAEAKRAEDEAREAQEEQRVIDDIAREKVAETYKKQLRLSPRDFQAFLADFEENHPSDSDTPQHLLNLKNPVFMATINKRKRLTKNKEDRLENVPYPELKPSKEDIANEKRKRGRLMDPVRFDDMKMADAYGLEYSAHIKHYGAQPLPDPSRRSQYKAQAKSTNGDILGGLDVNESSRTRVQRSRTKRMYEAEVSASPESDEDGLPAKRARRPKTFEDGAETSGRSRATPYSRGSTPPVKVFKSGKRVGRPPAKSKLHAVQTAPRSESPESPLRMTPGGTLIIRNSEGNIERTLPPFEEAQLHHAAESLVTKAVSDNALPTTPVKKKHAGGRPRKVVPGAPPPGGTINTDLSAPVRPKNKGGRPRKLRDVDPNISAIKSEAVSQNDETVLQSTEQIEGSQELGDLDGRRPKRKRTSADSDQSPIVVEPAMFYGTDPLAKRRRTRGSREESEDTDSEDPFGMGDSTIPISAEHGPNPKKRRPGGPMRDAPIAEAEADVSDVGIDELSLDPAAMELLRLERVKKEKSRKLSESMKARWANGGMKEAQETRKANNAAKKAAKQAAITEAQVLGIPYIPPIDSPTPGTPQQALPTPVLKLKAPRPAVRKDGGRKSKFSQPRNGNNRARKPARRRDDDGDDDDEEGGGEVERQLQSGQQSEQFRSEYDHYQALTSPKSPYPLGKRVRKSLVDLSQVVAYESDESEEFEEEEEEDEAY